MQPGVVVPKFTKKAREQLIESGSLIWREINPDIFGSMFQAIVSPGKRSDLGQHYTSVPNILKTIEPLFLDGIREQLDAGFDNVRKLEALLERISAIKVFDPACGSGNFLVIAYKELRKVEHAILERLAELDPRHQVLFAESKINIENFYGIEIDDFAVEVAILCPTPSTTTSKASVPGSVGTEGPSLSAPPSAVSPSSVPPSSWEAAGASDGPSYDSWRSGAATSR